MSNNVYERILRDSNLVNRRASQITVKARARAFDLSGLIKSFGLTLLCLGVTLVVLTGSLSAQELTSNARYAAIVMDAQSGEVLYERRADAARYPASLTKVMTLYMAFEALSKGDLMPEDLVVMSAHANAQAPVKVGFRKGDTISLDAAIRLTALYSANDLASAIAEKIGGTEERFAALMTVRAQELGMTQTRFVNASGLPDARQLSSARDMALLARAVLRDFPQYYDYFHIKSYVYKGRTYLNHNPLLGMPGVDGMKTGFTNAAGYNLVASQVKDDRRLITVMLGGNNKEQRRQHVSLLMGTGFDVMMRRQKGETTLVADVEFVRALSRSTPSLPGGAIPYTLLAQNTAPLSEQALRETLAGAEEANLGSDFARLTDRAQAPGVAQTLAQNLTQPLPDQALRPAISPKPAKKGTIKAAKPKKDPNAIWVIQVGAFKQKSLASDWLKDMKKRFAKPLKAAGTDIIKTREGWYRSRFVDLTRAQAKAACKAIEARRLDCMIVGPDNG
jgi:D-alanyl-D-alanine carboxypeptidase